MDEPAVGRVPASDAEDSATRSSSCEKEAETRAREASSRQGSHRQSKADLRETRRNAGNSALESVCLKGRSLDAKALYRREGRRRPANRRAAVGTGTVVIEKEAGVERLARERGRGS